MLNAGTDLPWGSRGVRTLPTDVYPPPPLGKSSTTLKNLLDHTFSAFRVAISGTSTVSMCRSLETI